MTADMLSTTTGGCPAPKTITICLSNLQSSKTAKKQQIIVIPNRMLVNGCISAKSMENRTNLKRPSSSGDSTYGTDSEEGSSIHDGGDSKVVRKRANLNHLSSNEKLMRRKVKNRVAAQNARHKKREKMEEMERDLDRLKAHAKSLEARNAQLVSKNERLVALVALVDFAFMPTIKEAVIPIASLVTDSKLLLNVIKAKRCQKKLPIKKRVQLLM